MNINFTVCITYFFKRNNIRNLIKKLKIESNKDIEIIISNDNPLEKLKIENHQRIKVFNNKRKPKGEIKNIKYLLSKAKGKYVCVIADDDLIHSQMFEFIRKDNFQNLSYLSRSTIKRSEFGNKQKKINIFPKNKIIMFLEKKLYLSGTVGAVYEKNFITKIFKKIKIKKYLLDTLLLFKIFDKNFLIYDQYLGFNNTSSSNISAKKIDLNIFNKDYLEVINNIKCEVILDKFVLFILHDYYSIICREEKFKIKCFYKFLKLNLKNKKIKNKSKIKFIFIWKFYLLLLILKAI
tara:strand:+ start:4699 stop:5577 length:879 start_codon:yes stop_codon:yes gene_type:complete